MSKKKVRKTVVETAQRATITPEKGLELVTGISTELRGLRTTLGKGAKGSGGRGKEEKTVGKKKEKVSYRIDRKKTRRKANSRGTGLSEFRGGAVKTTHQACGKTSKL